MLDRFNAEGLFLLFFNIKISKHEEIDYLKEI